MPQESYPFVVLVLVLLATMLALLISLFFTRRKLLKSFSLEVGQFNTIEITGDHLEAIGAYSKESKPIPNTFKVDNITSQDLNLNELFIKLDQSKSTLGQEYLYKALHSLSLDEFLLKQRQTIADSFKNDPDKMVKTKDILAGISSYSAYRSFYKDSQHLHTISDKMFKVHVGLSVLFF